MPLFFLPAAPDLLLGRLPVFQPTFEGKKSPRDPTSPAIRRDTADMVQRNSTLDCAP
jgi:hypothetical protein